MSRIAVILLAGGVGSRMGGALPKQYLPLLGKPIARHSFELFASLPEIDQMIVVCHHDFHHYFAGIPASFAEPGLRRQDSVYNGLQKVSEDCDLVCIHDSARPFIAKDKVIKVSEAARDYGAAVLAVPVKFTVKQSGEDNLVAATLDRSTLWEIQTPQVVRTSLLRQAFQHAIENDLAVTDDVSLVEAMGHPVKIVEGDYSNIKITTPEDLLFAASLKQ
ncbi:MAG: 2-C-methyl-D-erythritol 4-phosphate cytidylyltransferase [Nitrosomonas sp.]|nr:MAG: 2-C-methyl-D-erythritol 4-phosphate cytidylyltransferase [Nitrosomonas sp.]